MKLVLTRHDIKSLRTDKGGFTGATLIALTGTNKPKKGWPRELVGKEILIQQYEAAVKGRTIYA